MHAALDASSYQPSLLSIPPGIALGALLVVIAYAAVVRGDPALRGWFLLCSVTLVPYSLAITLSPSIKDPEAATAWFRFGVAPVPLSASAAIAFLETLLNRCSIERRALVSVVSVALAVPCVATPWIVSGVREGYLGVPFAQPGPLAPLWLAVTAAIAFASWVPVARASAGAADAEARRRLRRLAIAGAITTAGLFDVGVAYDPRWPPVGWLLLGIGSALSLRALVVDDLLRVRAFDRRAPLLVVHFVGAVLLGWAALEVLGGRVPWWGQAAALLGSFSLVRAAVALASLLARGARVSRGPREEVLAELDTLHEAETAQQVSERAVRIIEKALGISGVLLLPVAGDLRWSKDGARLDDAALPDPRVISWLRTAPTSLGTLEELVPAAPSERRSEIRQLFEVHRANAFALLRSRDGVEGLFLIHDWPPPHADAPRLLAQVGERVAEALAHQRVLENVRKLTSIARDVELAADLQTRYLPLQASFDLGPVQVAGVRRAATQLGGDVWAVYELAPGKALVVVGDVTGHGLPPAMVTLAVRGACDVVVRSSGGDVSLPALMECLDAVVRRVGAERLYMSCSATIVDAAAGEVTFLNAAHPMPYVVHPDGKLTSLVARGSLLGTGRPPSGVARQPIAPGDLLVWYTDGVTDARRPGAEFDDRALQRLLRGVTAEQTPEAAAQLVLDAAVARHGGAAVARHGGGKLDDDATVVAARVRAPDPTTPA
ncbi:MAG: PP2C family protein-serine/threonine phosphatase [Kofleriaceae bacterium]